MNKKFSFDRTMLKYVAVVACILIVIGLRFTQIDTYINLAYFQKNSALLLTYINNNYIWSVSVFVMLYAIVVASAIPITPVLNVAAGYFFHTVCGTLYVVVGATAGSLIGFLIVRYFFGIYLQEKYARQLNVFNKKFAAHGALYLIFLELLPVMPFSIITIIAGISSVGVWTFTWATAVGALPGSLIYVYAGKELMYMNQLSDLMSPKVFAGLIILALLALAPILFKQRNPLHHESSK